MWAVGRQHSLHCLVQNSSERKFLGMQVAFGQNIWGKCQNSEHGDCPDYIIRLCVIPCNLIKIDPIKIAHTCCESSNMWHF